MEMYSQNLIVNNTRELIIACQKALPGDVIVLNDGIYQGELIIDQMSGKKISHVHQSSCNWKSTNT